MSEDTAESCGTAEQATSIRITPQAYAGTKGMYNDILVELSGKKPAAARLSIAGPLVHYRDKGDTAMPVSLSKDEMVYLSKLFARLAEEMA